MDERVKILEMVRDGKVTPEQAFELLNAIGDGAGGTIVENFVDELDDQGPPRRLRFTGLSGKGSASFDIPIGVIKFFHGLFPNSIKINVNNSQLDREQLMDRIYAGRKGVIYRDENKKGGEVVIELV